MAALPSTGITTSMVASAIGAATNDVGTLCKHPNVNKWSRFKPIDFNAIALPDDVRNSNTGFQLFDEVTGFGTVKKAEYVKPKILILISKSAASFLLIVPSALE